MPQMEKSDAYRKGSGGGKKWDGGGPGGPGGGPSGSGPRGPPRGLDNVRGLDSVRGDHSKLILPALFILINNFFLLKKKKIKGLHKRLGLMKKSSLV